MKDGRVTQIEGDPDSPDHPRAAVPEGLGDAAARHRRRARVPGPVPARRTGPSGSTSTSTRAMDMIADRVHRPRRRAGWQWRRTKARALRRTLGIASLGGATLDNEENYLIKKLFTALGAIQIENQARI